MSIDVSLIARDKPTPCNLCRTENAGEHIQVGLIAGAPILDLCRSCAAGLAARMDRLLRVPPPVAI